MYGETIPDENSGNGSLLNRVKATFLTRAADLAWRAVQAINTRLPEGELPSPKWAPGRIAKSRERSAPPLGFPRDDGFPLSALCSGIKAGDRRRPMRISTRC